MSPSMLARLAAGLAVLVLAGCGGSDGDEQGGAAPETAKVDISGFKYVPETARVRVGGKVTWTNRDTAPHTATASDGQPVTFDTRRLDQGQDASAPLTRPGTYKYFCVYHRFMTATVEVVEP